MEYDTERTTRQDKKKAKNCDCSEPNVSAEFGS
jgi:hypothetical protein